MQTVYSKNLNQIWESLLPAPDIWMIKKDGSILKIENSCQEIALHYIYNLGRLTLSILSLPITCALSFFDKVEVNPQVPRLHSYIPKNFGFANSGFQDGGIGTSFDPSSLNGLGTGDWEKILQRAPQLVTQNGEKVGETTLGVTLLKGEKLEDLFVNTIDHPKEFAKLLKELGATSYRISLERSVLEIKSGVFNEIAIEKYNAFFKALQEEGIEPWVTLHHFTNPQWFEDKGDFINEENIEGFVSFAEKMLDCFPSIQNWMTFNEPGIRGLEAYIRGEHPPQERDLAKAAHLIRNLLVAHTKVYAMMKAKNENLHIGITHQWLKFFPFSGNPIEKITAHFYTQLIHTPIFNFFKYGEMKIQVPFMANKHLKFEEDQKIADFLGVQAYGFPRLKIGLNEGTPHPGASDKVHNFSYFTAGSTCGQGGSMQYFGPPSNPDDLYNVLDEAFSIPKARIPNIGITETGSDAKRMDFGKKDIQIDNQAQAKALRDIFSITQKYPLNCLFIWTLNRHCEWLSGGMPNLGLTKLENEGDGTISYIDTPAVLEVKKQFRAFHPPTKARKAVS